MKFAISTDGDFVSAHFGRCPVFIVGEIVEGKVVRQERIDNPGHHPGFLPQFLAERGVTHIIAGGMGQHALQLFEQNNITPILGVTGTITVVLELLAKGQLRGGESSCSPGVGKGYGVDKTVCTHGEDHGHCD